jgi:hypothetical protein
MVRHARPGTSRAATSNAPSEAVRLEQELRALALDNAFGRVADDDYLRRKGALTAELGQARRPAPGSGVVDPARALAWLDDLRSLSEVELPQQPENARRDVSTRSGAPKQQPPPSSAWSCWAR